MTKKKPGSPDPSSGAGYHPSSRPNQRKDQPKQENVCEFCGYHNSHSPTCFENPDNKK